MRFLEHLAGPQRSDRPFPKPARIFFAAELGVIADGATNQVAAINTAIVAVNAAGGGILILPPGTIRAGDARINMLSKVHLRGALIGNTTLQLGAQFLDRIVSAFGITSWSLSDLTIDAGDFAGDVNTCAVYAQSTSDFAIERISITKMGTFFGILAQGITRFRICNNVITKTTSVNTQNEGIIITTALQSSFGIVANNILTNTGMELCLAYSEISGNIVTGVKFGGVITLDIDAKCHDLVVSRNICGPSTGTDINGTHPAGIECWSLRTVLSQNICYSNSGQGLHVAGQYCTVVNNICYDNGVTGNEAGIFMQFLDATFNGNNSTVSGNVCFNTNGAAGTQGYGYEENQSCTGITLGVNQFLTNKTGDLLLKNGSTSVPFGFISVLSADRTGTDTSAAQNVFNTTEDEVKLAASTTYEFEAVYFITRAAGTTSHDTSTLFGGTATFTSIDYLAQITNPTGNALANVQQIMANAATAVSLTAANTSATENLMIKLRGVMRINAAGTVIPQFKYSAAPGGAPTIKRNSFFRCRPIGPSGLVSIGAWS